MGVVQQSSESFWVTESFAGCESVAALVAALAARGLAHRESSKSVCLLGTDSVAALCPELIEYFTGSVRVPLCLKISRSPCFVAGDDVSYVWREAPRYGRKSPAYIERIGTVRSKLPIANLLSLHGVTPRIFDACVLRFRSGLRAVAQLGQYFAGIDHDRARTSALLRRLLVAMRDEGVAVLSPYGLRDPDFSSRSNNYCGSEDLRYVDTQKLVFRSRKETLRALHDSLMRAEGNPGCAHAQPVAPLAEQLATGHLTVRGRSVLVLGSAPAKTCAELLSAGARWVTASARPGSLEHTQRWLFANGFSRFDVFAAPRDDSAEAHLAARRFDLVLNPAPRNAHPTAAGGMIGRGGEGGSP